MCFFDEAVRQRQQNSGGCGGRLTDDAKGLLLEFARSKQEKVNGDEKEKIKVYFEECMDNALHGRAAKSTLVGLYDL